MKAGLGERDREDLVSNHNQADPMGTSWDRPPSSDLLPKLISEVPRE